MTRNDTNDESNPNQAREVRAVTFDLDDTLWPVWPAIGRAERAMMGWLEVQAPDIVSRFGVTGLQELRDQIAAEKPDLAHHISLIRILTMREAARQSGYLAKVGEQAFQVMWEERNRVDFYDDVEPALRQLRDRGLIMGSLSNGNADVDQVGVGEYFDFSLNAVSGGGPKPAITMFIRAAALAGCEPAQVVHVGDDPSSDVAGAVAAGMTSVWLNRSQRPQAENQADFEIASLWELPDLIARLTGTKGNSSNGRSSL